MNNLIKLKIHGDSRGKLISLQGNIDVPFNIKRVYYIYDTSKNVIRGSHAHKKLQQFIVCLSGSCQLILDNGYSKKIFDLNSISEGILINNLTWREIINFSNDCILLVLASDYYDQQDYIYKYDDFIKLIENNF